MWTKCLLRLRGVISESAENSCWKLDLKVRATIRKRLFSEVVTLACHSDELVALCRNRRISYSCHAVLLKPVPKLFPSFGEREATERGCKASQSVWITVVVTVCSSVSTWFSVTPKQKSQDRWETIHVHTICEDLCCCWRSMK